MSLALSSTYLQNWLLSSLQRSLFEDCTLSLQAIRHNSSFSPPQSFLTVMFSWHFSLLASVSRMYTSFRKCNMQRSNQTCPEQRPGQLWVKWWVCPHNSVGLYSLHKGVPIQVLVIVRCTVVHTVGMVLRSSVPPQKAILLCSSWCYHQGSRDGSRDVRGQLNYASDT